MLLRIVDLRTLTSDSNPNNIVYIPVPAPLEEVTEDHVLGGVKWITDNEIAVQWLNRRQNFSLLSICNVESTPVDCRVSITKWMVTETVFGFKSFG